MDGSDRAERTTDDTHGAHPTRRQVVLGAAAAPMLVGAISGAQAQVTAGIGSADRGGEEHAFTARMSNSHRSLPRLPLIAAAVAEMPAWSSVHRIADTCSG